MGAKRRIPLREKLPTLAAHAPALVERIEEAEERRRRAQKKIGGVKVRPATADAIADRPSPVGISPEQCLSAASWYLAEAVCLGFSHTRKENKREAFYRVPCDRCLEAGTHAVYQMYEKGVKQ